MQRLEQHPAAFGGQDAFIGVEAGRPRQVRAQAGGVHRKHHEEGESQPRVEGEESRRGEHDRRCRPQHVRHQGYGGDEILQVLGDPRGHLAAAGVLEDSRAQGERAFDHPLAQAGGDRGAEAFDGSQAQGGAGGTGQDDRPDRQNQIDGVRVPGARRVHQPPEQQRHDDRPGRAESRPQQGVRGGAAMAADRRGQDPHALPSGGDRQRGGGHRSTAAA